MAKINRLALFWRAFFLSLFFGSAVSADEAENRAWQSAVSQNTPNAYFNYLSRYPAGTYVDQAVNALVQLGAVSTRGLEPQQPRTQERQERTSREVDGKSGSGGLYE